MIESPAFLIDTTKARWRSAAGGKQAIRSARWAASLRKENTATSEAPRDRATWLSARRDPSAAREGSWAA
jgi:hypothetical protein